MNIELIEKLEKSKLPKNDLYNDLISSLRENSPDIRSKRIAYRNSLSKKDKEALGEIFESKKVRFNLPNTFLSKLSKKISNLTESPTDKKMRERRQEARVQFNSSLLDLYDYSNFFEILVYFLNLRLGDCRKDIVDVLSKELMCNETSISDEISNILEKTDVSKIQSITDTIKRISPMKEKIIDILSKCTIVSDEDKEIVSGKLGFGVTDYETYGDLFNLINKQIDNLPKIQNYLNDSDYSGLSKLFQFGKSKRKNTSKKKQSRRKHRRRSRQTRRSRSRRHRRSHKRKLR